MSYPGMIDKNLVMAFKLLKDLKITGVLTNTSRSDFNFTSGAAKEVNTDLIVELVPLPETKPGKRSILLLKVDVKPFDSIEFDGEKWKIGSKIKHDGYVMILPVYKEKARV